MITKLHVENYKSLQDFTMEVGRFNVLIGENGCGKSNILEAITLAGAAEADKLDEEFLVPRGIRITEPQFMRSAFELNQQDISIVLQLKNLDVPVEYILENKNEAYSKWEFNRLFGKNAKEFIKELIKDSIEGKTKQEKASIFRFLDEILNEDLKKFIKQSMSGEATQSASDNIEKISKKFPFKKFLIYAPENTALRNFEQEGQIQPLGINGQGLLKLLQVIKKQSADSTEELTAFGEIQQSLALFDWYEKMEVSSDLSQPEQKITIKDRYLADVVDQRNANEGFLFVLFYITLIVSKDTPQIFAIDNIDTSLNPTLCTKLITELTRLAKKYDKQIFITTHNPAILDGIDLNDDQQRLLIISRNQKGHTRCKRIDLNNKPQSSIEEPLVLSDAFLRGDLSDLPMQEAI
ncbi:MAG: AAA family ATPase [Methylococcales bacterium]|nr:AAA family ATPase [Methylococcales bacterium]